MFERSGERRERHYWENAIDEALLTLSVEAFGTSGNGQVSYIGNGSTLTFRQIEQDLMPSSIVRDKTRPKVVVESVDEAGIATTVVTGLLLGTSVSGNGMFIHDYIPEDGQLIGPIVIEHEDEGGNLMITTFTSLLAEPIPAAI